MKGQSTISTSLYIGVESADTKYSIKSYPDIGDLPDNIEVTDFEDESVKNVIGVASVDSIEFLANYMPETFSELNELFQNEELHFALKFGDEGEYGLFEWVGAGAVRINGGDVNSAREMTIITYPISDIVDTSEPIIPDFWIIPISVEASSSGGDLVDIIPMYDGTRWYPVDEKGQIITDV